MHSSPLIIDLLRHGEAEGGRRFRGASDDPLSERGWEQLWAAVEQPVAWDAIVSSDACRCSAFASKLAERRGLPLTLDAQLHEIDFGDWEGRTSEELMASDPVGLKRYWSDPVGYTPPQAESLGAFQQRILQAWEHHLAQPPGRHLLLVSHGGTMRIILAHILQMPLGAILRLDIGHAALCRVRVDFDDSGQAYPSLQLMPGGH